MRAAAPFKCTSGSATLMHFVSNQLLRLVLLWLPVHTLQQKLIVYDNTTGEQEGKKSRSEKDTSQYFSPPAWATSVLLFSFDFLVLFPFYVFKFFYYSPATLSPYLSFVFNSVCFSVLLTIYLDPPLFSLLWGGSPTSMYHCRTKLLFLYLPICTAHLIMTTSTRQIERYPLQLNFFFLFFTVFFPSRIFFAFYCCSAMKISAYRRVIKRVYVNEN